MIPLPSGHLPQVSSCHNPPDFASAKSRQELMTDCLIRTGLYFHSIKRTPGIDPSRISTEIATTASNIISVFKKCSGNPPSPPETKKNHCTNVALFLLHLEEGSLSKSHIDREFRSLNLDEESMNFLADHVGKALSLEPDHAKNQIRENPSLLLQIQNDKHENIVEVLLERLEQRASILTDLDTIERCHTSGSSISDLLGLLQECSSSGLFSWYVEKINGHDKKALFEADPALFFEEHPSLLNEMRSSFSTLQRDAEEIFHQVIEKEGDAGEKQTVILEFAKALCLQFQYPALEDLRQSDFPLEYLDIKTWNQSARIELAEFMAKNNPSLLVILIDKFGIEPENQEALINLAKIVAQNDPESLAYYIQDFGIDPQNQDALINLATIIAQNAPEFLAQKFNNFKIDPQNQDARGYLATIIAQNEPRALAPYIEYFGIDPRNQATRIKLANIIAQKVPHLVAKYIKSFGIDPQNQEDLVNLAKIIAQNEPQLLAVHIKYFRIDPQNQAAIVNLAKIVAQNAPQSLAMYIRNFGIDFHNQEALINLATIIAQKAPQLLAMYIQNFGIDSHNQEELINLATIIAQNAPGSLASSIKNFGIDSKNQEALINLATIIAQNDPKSLAYYIDSFRIESADVIASLLILGSMHLLLQAPSSYQILDKNLQRDVSEF
ncbi:MAG: hypothetical protein NTX49_04750, partial [Chlamydiae bacterium]|nr:hypothetical protein [Chlamydiota bacterium]